MNSYQIEQFVCDEYICHLINKTNNVDELNNINKKINYFIKIGYDEKYIIYLVLFVMLLNFDKNINMSNNIEQYIDTVLFNFSDWCQKNKMNKTHLLNTISKDINECIIYKKNTLKTYKNKFVKETNYLSTLFSSILFTIMILCMYFFVMSNKINFDLGIVQYNIKCLFKNTTHSLNDVLYNFFACEYF